MKVFKRFFTIILSSAIIFTLISCSKNTPSQTVDTESVSSSSKKFVVGFDAEYPPYGYLSDDGNSYEGFDLDLAREFCKRAGYEFVAQPIDWDSKDLELNSGNIDCIWNGFTINGREDSYTWSFPYVDNSIVLIVNSDSDINTKADLKDKVVMVQAASSGLAALESDENKDLLNSFNRLEQCSEYNSAFMNLESGVVDCVAVDIGVAKYKLNNSNGKFRQLDETVSSEQYAIGFKKGNTALKDEVEKVLSDMWKDGTFMNIANKYSDYSLPDTICIDQYIK